MLFDLDYVQKRYGRDQVAQIITFGTLQARGVLRDVGRVLEMPYGQVDKLCKLVPQNPAAPVTLSRAIADEPRLQAERDREPVVGRDRVAEVIRIQLARIVQLGAELRAAWVNGQPGLLASDADGGLIAVVSLDILDGQVQAIRTVANPEKLSHLGPVSQVWHLRSRD